MGDRPQPSRFHNLPVRLTRVIGREAVIDQLDKALDDRRLVTIAGPGGIGKSTVALAVAERKVTENRRDVCFIDLSLSFDQASVDAQFASTLKLDRSLAADRQSLVDQLENSEMLLLLDNCEHVIGDVAELAQLVGRYAPGVRMLATSREALGVPGERVYRLPSLTVPPREEALSVGEVLEFPAAMLFAERAAATGFVLADADLGAVIDICNRLDGIPLALELAASRVGLLGVHELNARLDDRFELLVGARRTAVPRHKTLLATLDWSYTTLTVDEQQVFVCLAVFRSPFALPDALNLLSVLMLPKGQCIQLIMSLVGKSLVSTITGRHGTAYRLLESARQYAAEKLDESPVAQSVRLSHARVCAFLVAGAKRDLLVLDRTLWLEQYGSLIVDLQAALQWAGSEHGDRPTGLMLASAAAPLAEQLFLTPGTFTKVLNLAKGADEDALRLALPLVHMQGHVEGHIGQMADSAEFAARRQEELGIVLPEVVAGQFGVALIRGDYQQALDLSLVVERLAVERSEPVLSTLSARVAAQALYYLGRVEEAKQNALAVIASPYEFLPHTVNNHRVSMRVILARSAVFEGDLDGARGWIDEAVALGRKDDPITRCLALAIGGVPVAVWSGDENMARSLLAEAAELAEKHSLQFWRHATSDLARSLDHVWGTPPYRVEPSGLEQAIGATGVDTLPTFAASLLTPRALERVEAGAVGWNAAEVLRVHALDIVDHSPERAIEILRRASALAKQQGARFWEQRIVLTLEGMPQ